MKRLARLLPLALVALPLAAYGQDPVPLEIPTEGVALDRPGAPPEPSRAGRSGPVWRRRRSTSTPAVPVGVTALPAAPGRTLYGTLKVGESTVQFAATLAEDGSATLYVDANRDGKFDPKEEGRRGQVARTGRPVRVSSGALWSSSELGGGRVALVVRERTPDFSVQVSGPPGSGAPCSRRSRRRPPPR